MIKLRTLLFALLFVFLCFGTAWAGDTIKIGFNAPLTGFAASDGQSSTFGAKLAVQQINEKGGINGKMIELVVYDDQANASQSIPIANKMIGQDKVAVGISGSYSGPTRSAAGIFQEAKIPYISAYAIHPDITKAGNYVFRTSFLGEVQGRAGAKLIGNILGKKRVVIITLKNDFGKSLAAGFKEKASDFGITIINEYEYSMKDRQFGAIIAKVKSDNPDAIYASGYYFTAGPMVSQLRASGVTVPVIGQEGYDSQKFIEIAGKAAEGVIITTSLDRDSKVPETADFIKNFEKLAGYKADMVAASGHTAVKVAALAIEKSNSTDPEKIRAAIAGISLKSATGTIEFNHLGEVLKDVQIQIVKNGEWHHYSVINDPELLAPPEK
ncbi:MAG: ABC transporter substrate-binding protein [Proteobacteria bacterium]|nr:ABC transporter substrate-binding protein [Pseudomonadota bacterium]MBU1584334.1 ABC transporter substrate-binding protein [Pseudomonadota bacterium]MBU2455410.1 ABC transporter substrate-binding protein [Pseudomonadota bacterium]MBU2631162.1 ABC transporter substrate-binding protein [Pseudomonadota bacterium]